MDESFCSFNIQSRKRKVVIKMLEAVQNHHNYYPNAPVEVSKHATKRMKERNGINKKSAKRLAKKAFESGYSREETRGDLRFWLDERFYAHQNEGEREIMVYGDKAYIFSFPSSTSKAYVLITIISVPKQHVKHIERCICH